MKKKPKNKPESPPPADDLAGDSNRKDRPGLPDQSTIVSEETFVSPKGIQYKIIRTNQKDASDEDE